MASKVHNSLCAFDDKENISPHFNNCVVTNPNREQNKLNQCCTMLSRKILYCPKDSPETNRKDTSGTEITHDKKKHRISFRDDIENRPVCDIYEVEQRKNRKYACNSCYVI